MDHIYWEVFQRRREVFPIPTMNASILLFIDFPKQKERPHLYVPKRQTSLLRRGLSILLFKFFQVNDWIQVPTPGWHASLLEWENRGNLQLVWEDDLGREDWETYDLVPSPRPLLFTFGRGGWLSLPIFVVVIIPCTCLQLFLLPPRACCYICPVPVHNLPSGFCLPVFLSPFDRSFLLSALKAETSLAGWSIATLAHGIMLALAILSRIL